MSRTLVASLALTLCSSVFAQANKIVTPLGFDTIEGAASSYIFGGFSNPRMQFIETQLTGKGAKTMKAVGHRRDAGFPSYGRSWMNVTLDCAETTFARKTVVFSRNYMTPPTRVFSASMNWPDVLGAPPTKPAVFSTSYAFPFGSLWTYSGNNDALLDFQFRGGALANNATWRSSSRKNYFLDAAYSRTSASREVWDHGKHPTTLRCKDTGHTLPAHCHPEIKVYPKKGVSTTTDDKLHVVMFSAYTARNALVVQVLDVAGTATGVAWSGITCNNLHVAASPAMLLVYSKANSTSGLAKIEWYSKWLPFMFGTTVWTQAAWDDSQIGRTMLSSAGRTSIPMQPPNPYRRACIYHTNPASTTGVINWNDYCNPIIQWTFQ